MLNTAGWEHDNHKWQVEYNLQRLQQDAQQILAHRYPADLNDEDRQAAYEQDADHLRHVVQRFVISAAVLAVLAGDYAKAINDDVRAAHPGFPSIIDRDTLDDEINGLLNGMYEFI